MASGEGSRSRNSKKENHKSWWGECRRNQNAALREAGWRGGLRQASLDLGKGRHLVYY